MYTHLKNVHPFFVGQDGFYEGERAEQLLKEGAIRPLNPIIAEHFKEEYEDRQISEPPEDRMMRARKRK
jgi:hypothetical protein